MGFLFSSLGFKTAGVIGAIALLALGVITIHRNAYERGRTSAFAEVRRANEEARREANDARDDCARDPARCVFEDPFTRDRGDGVPAVRPNPGERARHPADAPASRGP